MSAEATTIFALSSGQLPSGIAIVRVSGPRAGAALEALTGALPAPRRAVRAAFRAADGSPLDDGLVLWFPGPHSATGEDVVELHCHGGRAVVAALIAALAALEDLRPAEPGEFTRRAFENGKLDLTEAEALDDLIHADTEQQRRLALRQLGGLLGDPARDWRQRIIDAAALVEAGIDFSDEGDVAGELMAPAQAAMARLRDEIAAVLAVSGRSERLREGLTVAIVGAPNVGKSTLLNALARRDVAIVSPQAGTTRDALEVHLDLGGYPVTLIDTAGLRKAADLVEQEGIRRTRARTASADLVLWLDDGGFEALPLATDAVIWRVRTKADLNSCEPEEALTISVLRGDGMDELVAALTRFAAESFRPDSGLITRARHRALLAEAEAALGRALQESEPELVAEELRGAAHALGRLLGRVDVEDVLGAIFSRFCIGK